MTTINTINIGIIRLSCRIARIYIKFYEYLNIRVAEVLKSLLLKFERSYFINTVHMHTFIYMIQ